MDYYSDFPGPSKSEAKKQIVNNVKNYIKDDLKYINDEIINKIVSNTIENKFPNNETIGSVSGWMVFFYNDLTVECVKKLKNENIRLENYKKKLCATTISLNNFENDDILNDILLNIK